VVASALSIPPWSEGAFKVLNAHWQILRHIDDQGVRQAIIGLNLPEQSGFSVEELVEAVRLRRRGESKSADEPLRPQEYAALVRGRNDDGSRQAAWEGRATVRARVSRIDDNYRARARRVGAIPDRTISARLVGLHTLAHSLIGQWALDSGYPAASLRERLYVDDEMLGVLIYTATSDSAGSLGGVVAQARPGRLAASVGEAVARAGWCSADPLCIEADAAGVDSLNLAACHACILLPEVSCEESNVLLDRALLVGTPNDPSVGLLSHMLSE
jgi:hypothetical protein